MTPPVLAEILFGWDHTPGIVSVWADRKGTASTWRRDGDTVTVTRERFDAWLVARSPRLWEASRSSRVSCTELEGQEGSYRFLLSAPTVDALEDALIAGARRLGQTASRLGDLGGEIHHLGPIEQHLIRTGRTYFGGLVYRDLRRMQIDLETTSLDPELGRIFLVSVKHGDFETTIEARDEEEEGLLISELLSLIETRDPDVIENHNLFGFDLPFLATRAAKWNLPMTIGRDRALARSVRAPGRSGARGQMRFRAPGRELLDTMDAVRRHDFVARDLPSHGLKDVAKHFGVASKARVYVPGKETYATYLRDPARLRAYALDDVREVDGLSRQLFPATFELARMAPRRFSELAAAGPAMGVLEPILVRGYIRAGAALPPRPPPEESAVPHAGGAVHLFATGVAHRVVKADVASLYPSLMREFRIGPRCDRLGALLAVVDSLLALRLHHKALSKSLPKGSVEASHHDALSSAMKLVLNSSYGYMGAGGMALFSDRFAADEVTRRGRELLGGVLDDLRERGATLLEADTDGVYFAVREGTTEADERALVAAVAARLPASIRLEYEGRYQSMFSYEVKNYALLGYGGELVVRGVALRSSRSEPFGQRFLTLALACLLRGDVAGVRDAFLKTLDSLRERELPTLDVTTRVRITKSPEEYGRSRASHKEAAYEALLGAGRTTWNVGERIRFYRSQSRGYVHVEVSEASESQPRDYDVEHYEAVLVRSYAARLLPAFHPDDWERMFRTGGQRGLFDPPIADVRVVRAEQMTEEEEKAPTSF